MKKKKNQAFDQMVEAIKSYHGKSKELDKVVNAAISNGINGLIDLKVDLYKDDFDIDEDIKEIVDILNEYEPSNTLDIYSQKVEAIVPHFINAFDPHSEEDHQEVRACAHQILMTLEDFE